MRTLYATSPMKYRTTNSTSKKGINYVRDVVESNNCIFQKVEQENDLGIDAIVELIKAEKPLSKFVACQIKSGNSYFNKDENKCKIPVDGHKDYWLNYPLPVYGVVFIPEFKTSYWIDIKQYLTDNPDHTIIKFTPTLVNLFNYDTFDTHFIPLLLNQSPNIDFESSKRLFESKNEDEFLIGLLSLFKRHSDKNETWDLLIDYFRNNDFINIPPRLIYYLSYAPWHPDLFYFKDVFKKENQDYAVDRIKNFGKDEVIKLLLFIDEEAMISRGTLGQSVEAIISTVTNFREILKDIISDDTIDLKLREFAGIILAYHEGDKAIPTLMKIDKEKSWYVRELIGHLKEFKNIDLYG